MVSQAKSEHHDLLDKMNRSQDALEETESKLKIVQDKNAKIEQSIESETKAQQAKLAVRQRQVEELEAKAASLKTQSLSKNNGPCANVTAPNWKRSRFNMDKRILPNDKLLWPKSVKPVN